MPLSTVSTRFYLYPTNGFCVFQMQPTPPTLKVRIFAAEFSQCYVPGGIIGGAFALKGPEDRGVVIKSHAAPRDT